VVRDAFFFVYGVLALVISVISQGCRTKLWGSHDLFFSTISQSLVDSSLSGLLEEEAQMEILVGSKLITGETASIQQTLHLVP
jgi:hypothetical protein